MKIRNVVSNNRKNEFTVVGSSGITYVYPHMETSPQPNADNRVEEVFVDEELGNEAFTYTLASGQEGSVHIEQVLEYNKDPIYLAELLTYTLTLEARNGIKDCGLSMRQIAKRLKTSVPQLYRLLDPANTRKSTSQLITLLHILDYDVELIVKKKAAA